MIDWIKGLFQRERHRGIFGMRETAIFPINRLYAREQDKQQAWKRLEQINETMAQIRTQIAATTGGEGVRNGDS